MWGGGGAGGRGGGKGAGGGSEGGGEEPDPGDGSRTDGGAFQHEL